jgi:hypothetical protein
MVGGGNRRKKKPAIYTRDPSPLTCGSIHRKGKEEEEEEEEKQARKKNEKSWREDLGLVFLTVPPKVFYNRRRRIE